MAVFGWFMDGPRIHRWGQYNYVNGSTALRGILSTKRHIYTSYPNDWTLWTQFLSCLYFQFYCWSRNLELPRMQVGTDHATWRSCEKSTCWKSCKTIPCFKRPESVESSLSSSWIGIIYLYVEPLELILIKDDFFQTACSIRTSNAGNVTLKRPAMDCIPTIVISLRSKNTKDLLP